MGRVIDFSACRRDRAAAPRNGLASILADLKTTRNKPASPLVSGPIDPIVADVVAGRRTLASVHADMDALDPSRGLP